MAREVLITPAALVKPAPVRFLHAGLVPLSSLTMLLGVQGWGKTTYLINLFARATRGELPGDLFGEPVPCLLASAEDDPETTLVPRAIAAGADLDLLHFVSVANGEHEEGLILPHDTPLLIEAAKQTGARAIGLDPIAALLSSATDSHKDADVRRALAPLSQLASDQALALIGVGHFNKAQGSDPLARALGSTGFTAAPRSVMVFGPDPDCEKPEASGRRLLAHAKSNVAPRAQSIRCRLKSVMIEAGETEIPTSRVVLGEQSNRSAQDVLAIPSDEERSALGEATDFLLAHLNGSPIRSKELQIAARGAGISEATLRRAKSDLKITAVQKGDGWYWQLPEVST